MSAATATAAVDTSDALSLSGARYTDTRHALPGRRRSQPHPRLGAPHDADPAERAAAKIQPSALELRRRQGRARRCRTADRRFARRTP